MGGKVLVLAVDFPRFIIQIIQCTIFSFISLYTSGSIHAALKRSTSTIMHVGRIFLTIWYSVTWSDETSNWFNARVPSFSNVRISVCSIILFCIVSTMWLCHSGCLRWHPKGMEIVIEMCRTKLRRHNLKLFDAKFQWNLSQNVYLYTILTDSPATNRLQLCLGSQMLRAAQDLAVVFPKAVDWLIEYVESRDVVSRFSDTSTRSQTK